MLPIALIVAGIFGFSVPHLSHDSVTLLVQHYFRDNPPIVYLGDPDIPSDPRLADALVASGLFALDPVQTPAPGQVVMCGENQEVHLTLRGIDVASQRGWRVRYGEVDIPLGAFSLVTESLTYSKPPELPGRVDFDYWFESNASVPYLLSIAPASAWGSVGFDEGGGVGLDKANRMLRGTLPIRWDDGWVIEGPYHAPPPIC